VRESDRCRGFESSQGLVENRVAGAMEMENKGVVIVSGIKTGLDAVGGMEAIEKNLSSFAEGMPVLMQALDEIAKIHPCVILSVFLSLSGTDQTFQIYSKYVPSS
jgi:hypothetical protein